MLYEIYNKAKDDPDLAAWETDQLMSRANLHKYNKDVLDAKADANAASGRMAEMIRNIEKDEWENNGAGWCNKDKWEDFKVN